MLAGSSTVGAEQPTVVPGELQLCPHPFHTEPRNWKGWKRLQGHGAQAVPDPPAPPGSCGGTVALGQPHQGPREALQAQPPQFSTAGNPQVCRDRDRGPAPPALLPDAAWAVCSWHRRGGSAETTAERGGLLRYSSDRFIF